MNNYENQISIVSYDKDGYAVCKRYVTKESDNFETALQAHIDWMNNDREIKYNSVYSLISIDEKNEYAARITLLRESTNSLQEVHLCAIKTKHGKNWFFFYPKYEHADVIHGFLKVFYYQLKLQVEELQKPKAPF